MPSGACVEALTCTEYIAAPLRVTVPSELRKYSLITVNRADAETDWISGYCLYRPVADSRVFFHVVVIHFQ